jgi:hypothetical protein
MNQRASLAGRENGFSGSLNMRVAAAMLRSPAELKITGPEL